MSAAFALSPTGPPAPCGYPSCVLEAFHEGDHDFKRDRRTEFLPDKLIGEDNERLANLVTSYGVGTRSYNRSPERKEMKRQIEEAAARYQAVPTRQVLVELRCACPQRPFPHELAVHGKIRREAYNPELRHCWPWALMLSGRVEPSTEQRETSELMEVCKG